MIKRNLNGIIRESLARFPVVGLIGSRQTGKTTLAKSLLKKHPGAVYLDLELTSDMNKLADPELYLTGYRDRLVVLDEVQRKPDLFPLLRALVDQHRVPGRFLLLGSASPDLIRQSSESLAGRIIYHELCPLTVAETAGSHATLSKLWLRGGYPESYLVEDDRHSLAWRNAFIATYLERDLPQLHLAIPSSQLRKFWTMAAHVNGQLWNASTIAGSLGVTVPTVQRYMHILEDTFILRSLQPYHGNIKKRLIKAPKIYIRDTGLLHALLNLQDMDALQSHPVLGHSWEGFIIQQILSYLPVGTGAYFYRTRAGAEIDLVLVPGKGKPVAVEIKYGLEPRVNRGFDSGFSDLGCSTGYMVYSGTERYPLKKNVFALPATRLEEIETKI